MSQPKDDPDTPAHDAAPQDTAEENDAGPGAEQPRSQEEQPERKPTRMERRREKIREEIERNRRGEFVVPTWVLAAALAAIVIGWALLIILA